MLSPFQNSSGEKPSLSLQVSFVLRVLLSIASRPGWLVHFLLMQNEGDLRSHQLVGGVGLAHLPTLVLPIVGV
jgi:hypothetical protein